MKELLFLTLITAVLALVPAQAQQREEFPEIGVSVEVPAAWKQTKIYHVTDHLPASGLYHLINIENGQSISVRQEHCSDSDRRSAWVGGELPMKLHAGDLLKPLTGEEPVKYGEHKGFEMTLPEVGHKAYVFYLAKERHCYEVRLSSPNDIFAESAPVFQQLVNSVTFATSP